MLHGRTKEKHPFFLGVVFNWTRSLSCLSLRCCCFKTVTSSFSVNVSEERGEVEARSLPKFDAEKISLCLQHSCCLPPFRNENVFGAAVSDDVDKVQDEDQCVLGNVTPVNCNGARVASRTHLLPRGILGPALAFRFIRPRTFHTVVAGLCIHIATAKVTVLIVRWGSCVFVLYILASLPPFCNTLLKQSRHCLHLLSDKD